MVQYSTFPTSISGGASLQLWNVDARVGLNSTGDDVKLVQYLLARASEAAAYVPDKISGSSGIAVSNVDGIWGSQTASAMSWLEQSWKGLHAVVADSCIDQIPSTGLYFGPNDALEYKLAVLQWLYARVKAATHIGDQQAYTQYVANMPNDGQCPQDLAYALNAANPGAQDTGSSDPSSGSADGSDGGS